MDSNQQQNEVIKFEALPAEKRALALSNETSVFLNVYKFEQFQRVSQMLARADFVPQAFRNNVGNCMIALDLADRMKAHPIMLMQCMYVVHGRPGFEGKFLSALVNNSGRYEGKLKYEWKGEPGKPEWGCRAWAILKGTDERVNGPWVDWKMVIAEGWNKPKGSGPSQQRSKWETMPELMFMYRAASFFCNTHDSDLKMGMATIEELDDMDAIETVRGPGGTYTAGIGEKPAGLYDVNREAPEQTKPEEPTDGPNNGNPKGSDDADPSTPGSGGSVRESETEKEPAQTGQHSGPEQKTVKEPTVEEARKWCADNDIMGAYRSDKQNLVYIAAKSFNINVTSMPWKEAHQAVKDAMQPSKNEDPTEEEDGNGSNQSLVDLYDYFNEANVNCRNISGGVELFRQATKEAGMGTGQRPQGIEQATKFKEAYEQLLANHTVSSEMSMKKDREIDEPDMDAIMDSLQKFCNDKGLQFEMFKKFLNERSSKAGVPISALIENMLGNEDNAGNMIEAFGIWKKSEQF